MIALYGHAVSLLFVACASATPLAEEGISGIISAEVTVHHTPEALAFSPQPHEAPGGEEGSESVQQREDQGIATNVPNRPARPAGSHCAAIHPARPAVSHCATISLKQMQTHLATYTRMGWWLTGQAP